MIRPFDLWGQRGWCNQEVVGESNYAKEIRAALGADFKSYGTEVERDVYLIPEPTNRFDPNAVKVVYGGQTLGYLPKGQAEAYSPILTALVNQGWTPRVRARIWGREDEDWDGRRRPEFAGSVTLDLAEPHMIVPANMPPVDLHVMLPQGRVVQVTGEEKHMTHLAQLVSTQGECWIYVTLHQVEEQRARSTRTLVEVRVNGEPAGTLSPTTSAEMLPVLAHLAELDMLTAARAILRGNRVKADITLNVCKASSLTDAWLDAPPAAEGARPAEPPAAEIRGDDVAPVQQWRFVVPPEWPPPPAGWVPHQGWRPDPSWPPVPDGWQFWVRA
ncbi:HIRAN domain-containing protein [Micromonospora azadirachtae]|uniref:HIRAN domain-containing protein n=1 Tax=Micromonospora azadirachtae TaxID=1970735 RepID=A0ABW2ZXS9_9ACTN